MRRWLTAGSENISRSRNEVVSSDFAGGTLVDVTPDPGLTGLNRTYQGVFGTMKMLGGVLVFRRVAAADVAALQTQPQMNPGVSHFRAFFANVGTCAGDFDLVDM